MNKVQIEALEDILCILHTCTNTANREQDFPACSHPQSVSKFHFVETAAGFKHHSVVFPSHSCLHDAYLFVGIRLVCLSRNLNISYVSCSIVIVSCLMCIRFNFTFLVSLFLICSQLFPLPSLPTVYLFSKSLYVLCYVLPLPVCSIFFMLP